MKELYKRYVNKFEKAKAVAEKYGLSTEKIDNAVKEIDEKLKKEKDKKKRTQLMFEQMLRGLYLTQVQGGEI